MIADISDTPISAVLMWTQSPCVLYWGSVIIRRANYYYSNEYVYTHAIVGRILVMLL